MDEYLVHNISFSAHDLEQLGTKEKFWFIYSTMENSEWLFKYSRENTGEHWSEKVAEQLCAALGIPHVRYEIATSHDRIGVISENIVPSNCRMVMGNEVLHKEGSSAGDYPNPNETITRVKEHTITRVLGCLDNGLIEPAVSDLDCNDLNAGDIFCGYLMLDALISNQDRHHENWAILINNDNGVMSLCPTYDHAASLGRELTDESRAARLKTKDRNRTVAAFVRKARSEFFKNKADKKRLTTLDAFTHAIERREKARDYWINKLQELSEDKIRSIFMKFPDECMTSEARDFGIAMVLENRSRLLNDDNE